MNPVSDAIIAFLRSTAPGATSRELAEQFLKFKAPLDALCHTMVHAILNGDQRCRFVDGRWQATAIAASTADCTLENLPWLALDILMDTAQQQILHVSLWSVFPEPQAKLNFWLVDPLTLPPDDQMALCAPSDESFDRQAIEAQLHTLCTLIAEGIGIYVSGRAQQSLATMLGRVGMALPDESWYVSDFFRTAGLTLPRPLTLDTVLSKLSAGQSISSFAYRRGESLASAIAELTLLLRKNGIASKAALEESLENSAEHFDFTGKKFKYHELRMLPRHSGVYGFTDVSGVFIYIGKATDLRRRLTGYFKQTDESPEKIEQLRKNAIGLTTHICGSELECLLIEYRLIKKHAPRLNTQRAMNERMGAYVPLEDAVILLPHAQESMGMAVFIRKNQKILLKPFLLDCAGTSPLVADLEAFFYPARLAPSESDFPEAQIVERFVQRNRDRMVIIPANRSADASGLYGLIKNYWPEVGG